MKRIKSSIYFVLFLYLIIIMLFKLNIINNRFYLNISIINESRALGIYNININFFKTILNSIKTQNYNLIIYNILIFIPLGTIIYFKILKKHFFNFLIYFFITFIFIIFLELIQFIFKIGFFDIDIIFLNLLGYLIGYLIGYIINYFYLYIKI